MASAHAALTQSVRGLPRERRASGADGIDMASVLLHAQAETNEPADDDSDAEPTAQILGVLYAGTVNFALSLPWACTQIALHLEIAGRLAAEQVYQEALRDMRRTSSIQRWSLRETALGGHQTPASALLRIFPHLLHHDPRVPRAGAVPARPVRARLGRNRDASLAATLR